MVVVKYLVLLYILAILGVMILSWFPLDRDGVGWRVFIALRRLTDPVLDPVRRVIPPVGGAGLSIDISATLVLFVLFVVYGLL